MATNKILEELRATREKLLAAAGGDLHRYAEEARQRALASGRPIAEPTQRSDRPTTAPNVAEKTSEEAPSIMDLKGLGKETWEGVDPDEYVAKERDSWGG